MQHELKCIDPYYEDVAEGRKTFELRTNDRDYKAGDTLRLRQYDRKSGEYSGCECVVNVIKVYTDLSQFGLPADMCIMSIQKVKAETVPDEIDPDLFEKNDDELEEDNDDEQGYF